MSENRGGSFFPVSGVERSCRESDTRKILIRQIMHCRWRLSSVGSFLLLCLFVATTPCFGLEFQQNITVLDQQPAGSVIGQVGAGIPNASPPFSVYMTDEKDRNDLEIQTNGTIRLKTKVERSRKSFYEFLAIAADTIQIRVSISVLPLTNRPPIFNPSFINLAILETAPVESTFFLGSASDPDFGPSGIARYEISSGNTNNVYRLNVSLAPNGAKIVSLGLTKKLDYKTTPRYLITVRAYDTGTPALHADLLVNITIVNVFDNQPVFNASSFSAVVREDAQIGTSVISTIATRQGSSQSGDITYSLDQQRSSRGYGDFTINAITGLISVAQSLSFSRQRSYELMVVAEDGTFVRLQATAVVQIQVVSINIQPPVITLIFLSDDGSAKVTKSANPEDSIAYVSVSYPDQSDGISINVTLLGGDGYFGLRRVGNVVYLVVVSRSLDNAKPSYQMSVFAVDSYLPSRFAYKNFTLYVLDGDSSDLVFSQNPYYSTIESTALPGTSAVKVLLIGGNNGNGNTSCVYRIMPHKDSGYERFYIDRYSGVIITAVTFDCKAPSAYRLTVAALDPMSFAVLVTTEVVVNIKFVFNSPPFFNQTFYRILVPDRLPIYACVGQVTVSNYLGCSSLATDRIDYSLASDLRSRLPFFLNQDTGQICVNGVLDAGSTPSYDLSITATNEAGFKSTCLVQLSLIPTNRSPPTFTVSQYRAVISENLLPGSNIVLIKASDSDRGLGGRITYQIIIGNFGSVFNISSDSGYIQLRRILPSYPTGYSLTVVAVDDGALMSDLYANITIDVVKSSQTFPMFTKQVYEMRIPEDAPRGQLVGRVEMQNNARVKYTVLASESSSWFQLDVLSGQILTNGQLDREYLSSVLLNIQAQSTDGMNMTSFAQVLISITDANDNPPVFTSSQLALEVREDTGAGTLLYTAHATDKDVGDNAIIYYSLSGDVSSTFAVDSRLGEIRLQKPLQFPSKFSLSIVATDGGSPSRSATLNVTITTVNVNSKSPVFSSPSYHFTISDRLAAGSLLGAVNAVDADVGNNGNVSYYLSDVSLFDLFVVDPVSGEIYNRGIPEYSQQNRFLFQVVAVDGGFPVSSSSVDVTITIRDSTNNTPLVSQTVYNFSIAENQPPFTTVGFIGSAVVFPPNYLTFSLQSPNEYFTIVANSGEILCNKILDREEVPLHGFRVVVVDHCSTPRTTTVSVTVAVLDVNDNSPRFEQNSGKLVYVAENQPPGTRIIQMIARDPDYGSNGTVAYFFPQENYNYYGQHFEIDSKTGWISTKEKFDKQSRPEFVLKVVAEDGAQPPRKSSVILQVAVGDENQNELQLTPSYNFVFTVQENAAIGTNITSLASETNSFGEYYIMKGNAFNSFGTDTTTGNLYVALPLKFEDWSEYLLSVVIVENNPLNPVCVVALVNITVIRINVHSPQFEFDPLSLRIRENIPKDTVIFRLKADDFDSGNNGKLFYSLVSQHPPGVDWFQVDGQTGLLKVNSEIDYERVRQITVVVMVMDQGYNVVARKRATMTVVVDVTDVNDNVPVFDAALSRGVQILEDVSEGAVILGVCATDADSGDAGRVAFRILSGNEKGHFYLDPDSGLLSVARTLYRQPPAEIFQLNISAVDLGSPSLSSTFLLTITVIGVNENTPLFDQPWYNATILENASPGAVIASVRAGDRTTGAIVKNINLTYGIPVGLSSKIIVNPVTGDLVTNKSFDRELTDTFTVAVFVKTNGFPALYNTVAVQVRVLDINDNAPVFSVPTVVLEVPENNGPVVLHVFRASDDDTGVNGIVSYYITGGNTDSRFFLNKTTGALSCTPLDREAIPFYNLTIMAVDGGTPPLNSTINALVRVLDDNDNDPVFLQTNYTGSILENVPIGTVVLNVQAIDLDDDVNGNVSYALSNDALGAFYVDPYTGALVTARELDREQNAMFSFEVTAIDGCPYRPRSRIVRVNITILDFNDNSPIFTQCLYMVSVSSGLTTGQAVLTVLAVDSDENLNGQVLYTLLDASAYFEVDSRTGQITIKRSLDGQAFGLHTLQIEAQDRGSPPGRGKAIVMIEVGSNTGRVIFTQRSYNVTIPENTPVGTSVLTVLASLAGGPTGSIVYTLINLDRDNAFTVDTDSGVVRVLNASLISRTTLSQRSFCLVVNASSGATYNYTTINIALTDSASPSPRFCSDRYVSYVSENNVRLTFVTQVRAVVWARNGSISDCTTYWISSGNVQNAFLMDPPNSGFIKTNGILDREIRDSYRMDIQTSTLDRQTPDGTVVSLRIQVVDVNDNAPFFPVYRAVSVREGIKPGTLLLQVTANDVDLYPALVYRLSSVGGVGCSTGVATDSLFTIDRYSGKIWTDQRLDYESCTSYQLTIQVSDQVHNTSTSIQVNVLDENDNEPIFSQSLYQVSVPEMTLAGVSILRVTAADRDSGDNGRVTYNFLSPTFDSFRVNSTTGEIYTNRPVIYDPNQATLYFVIVATDRGTPPLSSFATVVLTISEVNKRPVFNATSYSLSLSAMTVPGSMLLQLSASDPDFGYDNSRLEYSISGGNGSIFGIGQDSGEIFLLSRLDLTDMTRFLLKVMVQDRGTPSLNSSATVLINVQVNENTPELTDKQVFVSVQENTSTGSAIATLRLNSRAQTRLLFNISSGNEDDTFSINAVTGVVSLKSPLNFELKRLHRLVISAVDINAQFPRFLVFSTVVVNVSEVNKHRPRFPVAYYSAAVTENLRIAAYVFTAQAVDDDSGFYGALKYRLVANSAAASGLFSIDELLGEVYTAKRLTFSSSVANNYSYVIIAEDPGGWSTSAGLTIFVKPEPVQPQFSKPSYSFQVHGNAKVGDVVGRVEAFDGNGRAIRNVIYFLRPENKYFAINSTAGAVYVKSDLQSLNISRRRRSLSRHKRATENVTLHVVAQSGFLQRKEDTVDVVVTVNGSCAGCAAYLSHQSTGLQGTPLILVIVFVAFGVLLAVVFVISFIICRRKSKPKPTTSLPLDPVTLPELPVSTPSGNASPNLTANKSFTPHQPGPRVRPTSGQSRSVSSGRGSVEKNEDVDEEISMINAIPSTIPSSRIPDSGIQQDDDTVSEFSVHNHREYLARLGIDASKVTRMVPSSVETTETPRLDVDDVIYTQLAGSERNSGVDECAIARSYGCKDMQPSNPNALSSIVNTEEVFSGSYNWDYLVNWGPQFLPMADLFTEIANLKDDGVKPKTKPTQIVPQVLGLNRHPRTVPPPLITDTPPRVAPVARPLVNSSTQPPQAPHSRTPSNHSLSSSVPSAHGHSSRVGPPAYSSRTSAATTTAPARGGPIPLKSPISYDNNFTSPIITPPFRQNMSPLGTQSPTVMMLTDLASVRRPNRRPDPTDSSRRQLTQTTVSHISSSNSDQEIHI